MAIFIGSAHVFAQTAPHSRYSGHHPSGDPNAPITSKSANVANASSLCPDCDGQNPLFYSDHNGIDCWDDQARPIASVPVVGGHVILWYSDACGTNWAETVQDNGTNFIADAHVIRADGHNFRSIIAANDIWSPMVYAPTQTAQACGSINNKTGGCTGSF